MQSSISPVTPGYVYYDQASQYGQPQPFAGFPDTSGAAYRPEQQAPAPGQPVPTPAPQAHSEIVIPPLQAAAPPPQQQMAYLARGPELQQMPEVIKEVKLGGPSQLTTLPIVTVEERPEIIDPCCTLMVSAMCFSLVGLVTFIIVVTVTSQLVYGNERSFCNNYVSHDLYPLDRFLKQTIMQPSFASSGPPKTTRPSSISSPEWYAPPSLSLSPRHWPHPPPQT